MAEETLYDSEAMRRFAGIELGDDRVPDETTMLNFRHLLELYGLTEAIFAEVLWSLSGGWRDNTAHKRFSRLLRGLYV